MTPRPRPEDLPAEWRDLLAQALGELRDISGWIGLAHKVILAAPQKQNLVSRADFGPGDPIPPFIFDKCRINIAERDFINVRDLEKVVATVHTHLDKLIGGFPEIPTLQ